MKTALRQIRWPVVVGVGVAAFVIGGVWYAALFPTQWVELHGFSQERMDGVRARFAQNMAVMIALDVVRAGVVGLLLAATGRRGARWGSLLGALLWLGVSLPYHTSFALSSGAPPGAFAIDASYRFIVLVVTGALVGAWGLRTRTGEST